VLIALTFLGWRYLFPLSQRRKEGGESQNEKSESALMLPELMIGENTIHD
jgi:hypothetical protein